MKTGWTPDEPGQPGGAAGFMARFRPDPAEGKTFGDVLGRALQRHDRPPEVPDLDETAANLMARGYRPGLTFELSQRLADAEIAAADERDKLARSAKRQEVAMREHAAGRVTAWQVQAMLGDDDGDAHRADQLERRAANLRTQIAEMNTMISPQQQQVQDPAEAASRHAHEVFREMTRAKMTAAAAGRPGRRPFGSASRGGLAVRSEVTCEACIAVNANPEESFLIHHTDADGRVLADAEQAKAAERAKRHPATGSAGYFLAQHQDPGAEITRVTDGGQSVPMIDR